MIRNALIAGIAFLLMVSGMSFAAPIPSAPSIQASITLTNTQSIATGANFQQNISFNPSTYSSYVANNLQNVDFTYQNGTAIPSWLESYSSSSALYWILLSKGIAANSNVVILMNIYPQSTSVFGSTVGEAPQLSPIYGQYDNGANVFDFYDNFSGTTLNSQWGATNIAYTINNGITVYPNQTGPATTTTIMSTSSVMSSGQVWDFYGNIWNSNGYGAQSGAQNGGQWASLNAQSSSVYGQVRNAGSSYSNTGAILTSRTTGIYSDYAIGSSGVGASFNYGTIQTATIGTISYPLNVVLYYNFYRTHNTSNAWTYTWVRVRNSPPNEVMPSVSFTSLHNTTSGFTAPAGVNCWINYTITNNQNIATTPGYQQVVKFNAAQKLCHTNPSINNIEWFYKNGTIIPSWLQSGNSSSTAAKYWLKLNTPISGNGGNITVSQGFNTSGKVLFNGVNTGEAPQLSSTYGKYDNGAYVFNTLYANFTNGFSSSIWNSTAGTANDGLTISSANYYSVHTPQTYHAQNNLALNWLGKGGTVAWYDYPNNEYDAGIWAYTASFGCGAYLLLMTQTEPGNLNGVQCSSLPYNTLTSVLNESITNSAAYATLYQSGSSPQHLSVSQYFPNTSTQGILLFNSGVGLFVQYLFVSLQPPNGVMPTVTTYNVSHITPKAPVLDVGQFVILHESPSAGNPPYAYQWYLGNKMISGATSSTYTVVANTFTLRYSPENISVTVTDSTGRTLRSAADIVSVDAAPTMSVVMNVSRYMDLGQTIGFATTIKNGAGPFTLTLIHNAHFVDNQTLPSGGGTAQLTYTPVAVGTPLFVVNVTDTGTYLPFYLKSKTLQVTVKPTPALTLTPSKSTIGQNKVETFNITAKSGVGPFEIELVNTTGSSNTIVGNVTIVSPGGSNSISITTGALGTFGFKAVGKDIGPLSPYQFVSKPVAITVT